MFDIFRRDSSNAAGVWTTAFNGRCRRAGLFADRRNRAGAGDSPVIPRLDSSDHRYQRVSNGLSVRRDRADR